jgi:hypothetical protein
VTLHKAGWKPAMDLLKANPNGRWRPILLLLRLVGVMLHRVRFVQRRWRRFESRFFLGHPAPREA